MTGREYASMYVMVLEGFGVMVLITVGLLTLWGLVIVLMLS